MAVARKTQKDVGRYQAKLVGPFTVKQSIFVLIAAILAYIAYQVMGSMNVAKEEKLTLVIVIVIPVIVLGFLEPYGMSCIEFLKQYYEYHILSSKVRIYETITEDERLEIVAADSKVPDKNKGKQSKPEKPQKKQPQPSSHKKLRDFPEYN